MTTILYYFQGGPQDGRYRGIDDKVTKVVLSSPGEATVTYQWNGKLTANGARIMVVVKT